MSEVSLISKEKQAELLQSSDILNILPKKDKKSAEQLKATPL